jgi:hypothetical protein
MPQYDFDSIQTVSHRSGRHLSLATAYVICCWLWQSWRAMRPASRFWQSAVIADIQQHLLTADAARSTPILRVTVVVSEGRLKASPFDQDRHIDHPTNSENAFCEVDVLAKHADPPKGCMDEIPVLYGQAMTMTHQPFIRPRSSSPPGKQDILSKKL